MRVPSRARQDEADSVRVVVVASLSDQPDHDDRVTASDDTSFLTLPARRSGGARSGGPRLGP